MREDEFELMKRRFDKDDLPRLRKKQLMCYEYLNWKRLFKTKFPKHEHFANTLTQSNISLEEYDAGKEQFKYFKKKYEDKNPGQRYTLKKYLEFYLTVDCYLLGDLIKSLRRFFFSEFQLELNCYYTLPMLSMDCFLKYTSASIELFSEGDENKLAFCLSALRGGVSTAFRKYARANNETMGDSYDRSKKRVEIRYFDFRSLYASQMRKALPVSDFEFITGQDNLAYHFELAKLTDNNSSHGYMLECDIEIPESLHDEMSEFPILPELKRSPTEPHNKNRKLISDILFKSGYILNNELMNLCIDLGLKVSPPTRILRFKQSKFLREYIDFNINLRNVPNQSKFKQKMAKLLSNSNYGKFLQLNRGYRKFHLVNRWSRYNNAKDDDDDEGFQIFTTDGVNPSTSSTPTPQEAAFALRTRREGEKAARKCETEKYCGSILVNDPNFLQIHNIRQNLNLIEMKQDKLDINTPIIVGLNILDGAKAHLGRFWHCFLRKRVEALKRFDSSIEINSLYTDTDSVVFQFTSSPEKGFTFDDLLRDCPEETKKWIDTSPNHSELFPNDPNTEGWNKQSPGFMVDEYPGFNILEFVALQSKCYSFIVQPKAGGKPQTFSRHKGIKRAALEKVLFEDFRSKTHAVPLPHQRIHIQQYIDQYKISRQDKKLFCPSLKEDPTTFLTCTVRERKKILNPRESKRFEIPMSIKSLAFGHKDIVNKYNIHLDYSINDNNRTTLTLMDESDTPNFYPIEITEDSLSNTEKRSTEPVSPTQSSISENYEFDEEGFLNFTENPSVSELVEEILNIPEYL